MEFVISRGFDLKEELIELRSSKLDSAIKKSSVKNTDYIVFANECSHTKVDCNNYFFDGQCSYKDDFFHSHYLNNDIEKIIDADITSGVFCLLEISPKEIKVSSDCLGQYPIYYYIENEKYLVSNNILMIEYLTKQPRSLIPAVQNLLSGGCSENLSHIEKVFRLGTGYSILISKKISMFKKTRDERFSYDELIHLSSQGVRSHINACFNSIESPYILADITGGVDSRTVLAYSLGKDIKVRCVGGEESPDYKVASYIAHLHGLGKGHFPVTEFPLDYEIRSNASLSGGGRNSGFTLPPIGYKNLIHLTGFFGGLGGAIPGINYLDNDLNLDAAIGLLVKRRRKANAIDLLTDEAIDSVYSTLITDYKLLLEEGIPRDKAVAEYYLRTRSKSHFGLASVTRNKSRIAPDPLANLWIVESGRKLNSSMATSNKVMLDLILKSENPELAFYPMANKKWSESIISEQHFNNYKSMEIIKSNSQSLTSKFELCSELPITIGLDKYRSKLNYNNLNSSKNKNLSIYQGMLSYYIESIPYNSHVWQLFSRDSIIANINKERSSFREDGLDISQMGAVSSALAWFSKDNVLSSLSSIEEFPKVL